MVKAITFAIGVLILIVLAGCLFLDNALFITGHQTARSSGHLGSGSGSGVHPIRPDTPRCNPPNNGIVCGEDCCLPEETCYPGGRNIIKGSYPPVCCPSGSKGTNFFGLSYCKKECDKKTEIECGETCCKKGIEQCKNQALGKHGVCLPLGNSCPAGTTPCPNSAEWSGVYDCCKANQDCRQEKIKKNVAIGVGVTEIVWGCTVNETKGCTDDAPILCKGKGIFKGYNICCKSDETCEYNINGGQPYCYNKKTTTQKNTPQKISLLQKFLGIKV